jgi:hypothetical protein
MLLLPVAAVMAGGWVVITVDTLPGQIHAGEATEISFMVRQHGQTPIHSVEPQLTATNIETGQQIQVQAQPAPEIGRFIATVDFPNAGTWEWSISAIPFPQIATFAPLTVLATQGAVTSEASSQPVLDVQIALRWGGLALLVVAMFLLVINRRQGRQVTDPASGD